MRRLAGSRVPAHAGDFRLMSRSTLDALAQIPDARPVYRLLVPWLGFPSAEVRYVREPRAAGRTKYPVSKMVRLALDSITSFSAAPLRIATWLGLLGILVCLGLLISALVAHFAGSTVPGWSSLYVAMLFLGAVQLFCLGMLGEYVSRIFTAVQNRPAYFVGYDSLTTPGPGSPAAAEPHQYAGNGKPADGAMASAN
jgi:dolichol-phosphate mannosyltransferase